ncbi:MAG: tRNA pseudouridine(38-40) synthase TruA [Rikenellaceae bacterium]
MRYFIELSYNGGNYCGWQRQNNAPTIQEQLENALATLLRTATPVTGAGRTDTGVHASFYVAHFDAEQLNVEWLKYKLNILLPKDIAIRKIYQVADSAHARFDAVQREYTYVIESEKSPFNHHTSWYYSGALDIDAMNRAAAHLLRYSDFTTFAKLGSDNKTNICDVRHAEWVRSSRGELIFTIRADRFLRNMIRAIVGTLVDVGRGRYTPEEFEMIIANRDLSQASTSAPAQGLFLSDIQYPTRTDE